MSRASHAVAVLVGITALLGHGIGLAQPAAHEQAAIDHLLEFIQSSSCSFDRNGRVYDGARAHSHVMRKFNYFADEIETAAQFIEFAASRSTRSGEPYYFVCSGKAVESATVLHEQLERFRAAVEQ